MPLTPKGNKILGSMEKQYGEEKGKRVFYASRNAGKISGVDPESSKHMPTGTPGHFSGGAKGSGKGHYDTATQTFRKPKGGSTSGFAGKTSTVRPLTPQEHQDAADHLAAAGQHEAAAHHRSAAQQMETEAPTVGEGEGSMENGMYGNKTGGQPKLGSGERFANLKGELAHEPGIKDPGALAASIGRKKYGAKKFNSLSHKG